MNHQLPLSDSKQGRSALKTMNVNSIQNKKALLKGIFFRPWNETSLGPRNTFHPDHLGVWLYSYDLHEFIEKNNDAKFLIRNRPDWISPARCSGTHSISSDQLLEEEFKKPTMVSLLRPLEDVYFERQRFFVVPPHWRGPLRRS